MCLGCGGVGEEMLNEALDHEEVAIMWVFS